MGVNIDGKILIPIQLVEAITYLNERGKVILEALIDTHHRRWLTGEDFKSVLAEQLKSQGMAVKDLDLMVDDMKALVSQVSKARYELDPVQWAELQKGFFEVAHRIQNSSISVSKLTIEEFMKKNSPAGIAQETIKTTTSLVLRILSSVLAPGYKALEATPTVPAPELAKLRADLISDIFKRSDRTTDAEFDVILLQADIVNENDELIIGLREAVAEKSNITFAVYGLDSERAKAESKLTQSGLPLIPEDLTHARSLTVISHDMEMPRHYERISSHVRKIRLESRDVSVHAILIAIFTKDIKTLLDTYGSQIGISDEEKERLRGMFELGARGMDVRIKAATGDEEELKRVVEFVRQAA